MQVDLGYEPAEPPEMLFHGTVEKFLPSIREQGLLKGSRHHVHLSFDEETANKVGSRRGRPVLLHVWASRMHKANFAFYITPNNVWLTEHVPAEFLFYALGDEYGCFSNFSPHPFKLRGKRWPTSEHYFQAHKFAGTQYEEAIRKAKSPMIAARMGRSRKRPLRRDWESIKVRVMREAVLAKFQAHDDIREILLATGSEKIVEDTTRDYYWGCGAKGNGKNKLGLVLMEVRDQLREEMAEQSHAEDGS